MQDEPHDYFNEANLSSYLATGFNKIVLGASAVSLILGSLLVSLFAR
jgi:hypothetical protein